MHMVNYMTMYDKCRDIFWFCFYFYFFLSILSNKAPNLSPGRPFPLRLMLGAKPFSQSRA